MTDERQFQSYERIRNFVTMALVLIFVMGISNFAMHRAVIESRHPLLAQMRWLATRRGRLIALAMEFMVLLAALLLTKMGWPHAAFAYSIYTAFNGLTAWLILSGRA